MNKHSGLSPSQIAFFHDYEPEVNLAWSDGTPVEPLKSLDKTAAFIKEADNIIKGIDFRSKEAISFDAANDSLSDILDNILGEAFPDLEIKITEEEKNQILEDFKIKPEPRAFNPINIHNRHNVTPDNFINHLNRMDKALEITRKNFKNTFAKFPGFTDNDFYKFLIRDKVKIIKSLTFIGPESKTPLGHLETFDAKGLTGIITERFRMDMEPYYGVDIHGKLLCFPEANLEFISRKPAPPNKRFFIPAYEDIKGVILKDKNPGINIIDEID